MSHNVSYGPNGELPNVTVEMTMYVYGTEELIYRIQTPMYINPAMISGSTDHLTKTPTSTLLRELTKRINNCD